MKRCSSTCDDARLRGRKRSNHRFYETIHPRERQCHKVGFPWQRGIEGIFASSVTAEIFWPLFSKEGNADQRRYSQSNQTMTTTLDSKIFGPLFGDSEINELLTDEAYVRALVEVETALARAEARLGVIPSNAAERISSGAQWNKIDLAALRQRNGSLRGAHHRFGPAITPKPLAQRRLAYVHWGATTQDIMDTGCVLQLRAAIKLYKERLVELARHLSALSNRHRGTVLGRAYPRAAGTAGELWLESRRLACAVDSPRRASR